MGAPCIVFWLAVKVWWSNRKWIKPTPDHLVQRPKQRVWEVTPVIPIPSTALAWLQILGLLLSIRQNRTHEDGDIMGRLWIIKKGVVCDSQKLCFLNIQACLFLHLSHSTFIKRLACNPKANWFGCGFSWFWFWFWFRENSSWKGNYRTRDGRRGVRRWSGWSRRRKTAVDPIAPSFPWGCKPPPQLSAPAPPCCS